MELYTQTGKRITSAASVAKTSSEKEDTTREKAKRAKAKGAVTSNLGRAGTTPGIVFSLSKEKEKGTKEK